MLSGRGVDTHLCPEMIVGKYVYIGKGWRPTGAGPAGRGTWRWPSFTRHRAIYRGTFSRQILTVSGGMEGGVLHRPEELDPSAT